MPPKINVASLKNFFETPLITRAQLPKNAKLVHHVYVCYGPGQNYDGISETPYCLRVSMVQKGSNPVHCNAHPHVKLKYLGVLYKVNGRTYRLTS